MDKPELDTLSKVSQLKTIIESKGFSREINCIKKKIQRQKEKNKYCEADAKENIEFSVNLELDSYLNRFGTSLEELEENTGIPKNKIKEFFTELLKEKVFST